MKLCGKKLTNIIIVVALSVSVVGLSLFFGLFFGLRNRPESVFARAEENWNNAENRTVSDEIVLDISIGEPGNNIDLRVNANGTRKELADGTVELRYDVLLVYLLFLGETTTPLDILGGEIVVNVTPTEYKLKYVPDNEGKNISTQKRELTVSADTVDIPKDLLFFSAYDTSKMVLSKTGEYSISAEQSIGKLKSTISPLTALVEEIDIMSLINTYLKPSNVRGKFEYNGKTYAKKVTFGKVTSSQNYSVSIPWEVVDSEVAKLNIGGKIGEILTTKKIDAGFITIDLMDYCPNGFRLSGTLTASTTMN